MATSYEWTVNQGQDETLTITFKDSAGTAVDFSALSPAVTSEMQLRSTFVTGTAATKIFSVAQQATATVTFSGANNTNLTYMTIYDSDGLGKTFKCSTVSDTNVQLTAASSGPPIVLQSIAVADKDTAYEAANELVAAITAASSFDVTAVATDTEIVLTQDAAGKAGNTTLTTNYPNAVATSFTGGHDSEAVVSTSTAGLITVTLTSEKTAALSAPATYLFDIELTNYPSSGKKFRVLEGTIKVRPEVTR